MNFRQPNILRTTWYKVAIAPIEYPATVNKDELGNLGLTLEEEAALVAFMKTLTDGYDHHRDKPTHQYKD